MAQPVEGPSRPRLVVVIAVLDERSTIEELTRRLDRVLRGLDGWTSEILYVIEGRDGTLEIARRLGQELGGIRILYQEEPSGLGRAFRRGFAAVPDSVQVVATMDADLNHQPEELPRLLSAFERTGADLLVGSRAISGSRVEGTPRWKRWLSAILNRVLRIVFGVVVHDKTSGYRLYRHAALRQLEFRNDAFAFLPEMLIRAHALGLRVAEAPIQFIFRRQGVSKMRVFPTSLSYISLLRTRLRRSRD